MISDAIIKNEEGTRNVVISVDYSKLLAPTTPNPLN
jgi:hypothetical protein